MILIGSEAIKHWFPDFPRNPKDKDYIVKEIPNWTPSTVKVEYLKNPIFDDYSYNIMLPNDLYTLLISHMFWDINWEKHMFSIQFLRGKGCKLDKDLFYKLYNYWNIYHKKNKRSNLKMSAEDFFDNNVKCEYSHDYIHTLLKNPPTYTKILKGEVEVCEEKFNLLSKVNKLSLVVEECCCMAFERFQNLDYRHAYSKMLKKFIINHAPLWEAIFIIENYIELHKINFNYFKQINNGLQKIK